MFVAKLAAAVCVNVKAISFSPASNPQNAERPRSGQAVPFDLLWEGIDILDIGDEEENMKRFGPMEEPKLLMNMDMNMNTANYPTPSPWAVGVEVIGLQDTGTNLLTQLLFRNFKDQVEHYDSTRGGEKRGVWKHANMQSVIEEAPVVFDNIKKHKVTPLVIVRNPMSWLQSIKKAPYELASCVSGTDWLTRPCTHRVPAGYVAQRYHVNVNPLRASSLSGIWGRWTKVYEPILRQNFDEVLVVKYEDLVLRTEETIRKIGSALNLKVPATIDVVENPAKNHGAPVGHHAAVVKLKSKQYLQDYTAQELHDACMYLEPFNDTMRHYGYDDCSRVG